MLDEADSEVMIHGRVVEVGYILETVRLPPIGNRGKIENMEVG